MNVCSLDLEMNQPSDTIIQIGICIGSTRTGEIHVKRQWNIYTEEVIAPFITQLTGVTQEDVAAGVSLLGAYNELGELYKQYDCSLNFISWGGGDSQLLRSQLPEGTKWLYGKRWFDVKTLYQAFILGAERPISPRAGLAKAMIKTGLKFNGTKHTAMDDATNTFLLMKHLLDKLPKDVIR